jgi:cytochrome c556
MRRLFLLAALVAIPLTAIARQDAPAPGTPEEFVTARVQRMAQGGDALAMMKATLDSGGDLAALAPRIEWLTRWSQELPTLFPAGSDTGSSVALPEVWSDRAGFETAAAHFRTAVEALAAPAAAGDRADFRAAWTAVRASCDACHDHYRM